jgi:hypothetical protein
VNDLRNMRQPERTLEQAAADLRKEALRTLDPDMFRRALVLEQTAFNQSVKRLRVAIGDTKSC